MKSLRIALLLNPKAGSAGQGDAVRAAFEAFPGVTLMHPDPELDLREQVQAALKDSVDVLAVAGGDGTIHGVVNALGPAFPRVPLLLLPLGTGNDLCRTLAVPLDAVEAVGLLKRKRPRGIDAVRVEGDWSGFLVNVATGGFSGKVAAEVTSDLKAAWGPMAYLRGAAGTIADPPKYRVTLQYDGNRTETLDVLNIVIANARTAAGGYVVAPLADPEDGRLDVVLVHAVDSVLDKGVITARLLAGDYVKDDNVTHRRAKRVEMTAEEPIPLSVDGELVEGKRFAFTVAPQALRVFVGQGYRRSPRLGWVGNTRFGDVSRRAFGLVAGALNAIRKGPNSTLLGMLVAATCLGLFAILARGVTAGEWDEWNLAVRSAVRDGASPNLDAFANAYTTLGGGGPAVIVGVTAAIVFFFRKQRFAGVLFVAVMLGTVAIELGAKSWYAITRPAPADALTAIGEYSFPSGHTLRAVGLAGAFVVVLLSCKWKWWTWPAVVAFATAAAAVGWTRVYLGVHWPTDVVASGLLGSAWVCVCVVVRDGIRGFR
jgi:diacylglycerol kinase (ATP)